MHLNWPPPPQAIGNQGVADRREVLRVLGSAMTKQEGGSECDKGANERPTEREVTAD